ncbi:coiled-coil domain-containing protein 113 isoform X1 [Orussus abietinus]|uniref:coiled-coil domain-containing protein 113 isoform X1 n=1 Tax=Orussus abietinus TaxID=222816 RepID=UPI0006262D9E|nr:coiled-coil domain-containing protein 113 isoform X1 [Orussus abietinus]
MYYHLKSLLTINVTRIVLEMSDEDLKELLEQTLRTNRMLALENDVFERYLTRYDPQCLQTMAQILESAKQAQMVASQLAPISSVLSLTGSGVGPAISRDKNGKASPSISSLQTFGSRRFTGIQTIPTQKGFKITLTHRMEMASREIEEMKRNLLSLEKVAAKKRANLAAEIEEVKLRIMETTDAALELDQVVKKGLDPISGKIPAEKFIRYMEDWLKTADSIVEKLRLKSSTLKSQIKKAKQQLQQREETGETLRAIDFEQLAIENQDYVRKIEEKNHYLLEMKKISGTYHAKVILDFRKLVPHLIVIFSVGRYGLELTDQKQKLNDQMSTLKTIKKDIEAKKQQISKLENQRINTETEVQKTSQQVASILQLMDEYTAPEVLDFVKIQAELREMQKTYKRLDRHKNIQMITIKTCKKRLEGIKQDTKPSTRS